MVVIMVNQTNTFVLIINIIVSPYQCTNTVFSDTIDEEILVYIVLGIIILVLQ